MFATSYLIYFPLILGIRGLALSSVSMKDRVPKFALVTGASLFGDVILILAAELSIACFPDNSAQSRTAGWDRTKCGSLFVRYVGLLSPKGPKPLNSSPC